MADLTDDERNDQLKYAINWAKEVIDRAAVAQELMHPQIYPAADEIVKRQRNEALDRCARLEADLEGARVTISAQSNQIVELASKLQAKDDEIAGLGNMGETFNMVYGIKNQEVGGPLIFSRHPGDPCIDRASLTDKERADLDASNSSVQ